MKSSVGIFLDGACAVCLNTPQHRVETIMNERLLLCMHAERLEGSKRRVFCSNHQRTTRQLATHLLVVGQNLACLTQAAGKAACSRL